MRYLPIAFLLLGLISYSQVQKEIVPGMSMEEFNLMKPGIIPEDLKYNKNGIQIEEEKNGLKGTWVVDFRSDMITGSTYFFRDRLSVFGDVDTALARQSFDAGYSASLKCIDEYTAKYGKPVLFHQSDTLYKQVNYNLHSYTIVIAVWELNTMKIELEFALSGINESQYYIPNSEPTSFYYLFSIKYLPCECSGKSADEKFYIGQSVTEFAKVYPELFPIGINHRGQWEEPDDFFGLKDNWVYFFDEGKLTSYNFAYYSDREEVNQEKFDSLLQSTDNIVEAFKLQFGKPTSYTSENRKFKDPYTEHHWGYDVVEAKWKLKKHWISVEYQFFGGKGDYFFLVKVDVYAPGYEYF